jgi:hypothetical protein
MDETKQQQNDDTTPVVSPLAKDKTYGERWYSGVFDWGLNYWTNLLSSAGFSQYAEHGTAPIKLPGMKEAASPRDLQKSLAKFIEGHDPFMQSFKKKMEKVHGANSTEALLAIGERSMARARSLTLLMPGFFVVIPTVWIGAKIKPWFVKTLNKMHYGTEAMDDPTLAARQQAIEAEARPTLLGAFTGRMGTFFAAQATAQLVGSEHNFVNKIGEKCDIKALKKFGVDGFTKKFGADLGGKLPEKMQLGYSSFLRKQGLGASEEQLKDHLIEAGKLAKDFRGVIPDHLRAQAAHALKDYTTATQDLGRFVVADTFYTMVTALTIHPILKALSYIPGMSYKPKMPENSARFEGDKIKVPSNHYAVTVPEIASDEAVNENTPSTKVSHMHGHIAPHARETQIA